MDDALESDPLSEPLLPWEQLFPKQAKLFNSGIESEVMAIHPDVPTVIIADGPRYSTKTIGCCHRVLRAMWEIPESRWALIVKTTGSATDGGVWFDLTDIVVPMWLEANFGFEYTTFDQNGVPGPKTDAKTRTIYFRTTNAHGGESELRLLSLKDEQHVLPKLRSTRWSGIWFSELSNFYDPNIFRVSHEQLRMWHLKPYQHIWLGDCNPSHEGTDSWIYKMAYLKSGEIMGRDADKSSEGAKQFARSIHHVQFTLDDNLAMTEPQKQARRALYEDDEGELQRMFYGNWFKGQGDKGKHFAGRFSESIHVIGGGHEETDSIEISPTTEELLTGWDLGDSVNHCAGVIEKRTVRSSDGTREWPVFCILEAIKHVGEEISIGDVTIEMMELIGELESHYMRRFEWTHYSDDSALTVYRAASSTFDALEVEAASNGVIELTGVPKPNNSVKGRVDLIKRLLRENRLFVAAKCTPVIDMFKKLRRGAISEPGKAPTWRNFVMWDEHKHTFDWISYVLWMECGDELTTAANEPFATRAGPAKDPSISLV